MEGITVHHTHIIYTKDDRSRVKPRFMHGGPNSIHSLQDLNFHGNLSIDF